MREAGALCVWRDGEQGALCAGLGRCARGALIAGRAVREAGALRPGGSELCAGRDGQRSVCSGGQGSVPGSRGLGVGYGEP